MEQRQKNPMGYENVFSLLLRMSFPAMLSMLIQSLYNITDSYFVAQYSEKALRATSLSFPIQIIIVGVGVGTGIGINSYISRALGSEQEEWANQGVMHGLLLIIVSWLVFLLFKMTLLGKFFDQFTSDPTVKSMGIEYLGLITSFSFLAITQLIIEKTIQGTGNMKYPMIIQLLGAITNIILDPIFIFGKFGLPAMGIRGAAIATLIGQGVGASLGLFFLLSGKTVIEIDFKKFQFSRYIVRDIYRVGFPSMLMNSVTAFVTTVLNLILGMRSEIAVSVLGIYLKLESFVMMPVLGLGQGVLPMVGYNFGAKNKERIEETYKYGVLLAILIMVIGTSIFQLFPKKLIGLFTEDPEMITMGVYALRIISIGYIGAAVAIINSIYFQALGVGKYSLLVTSIRQIIVIIPLAYVFSKIGINYVWIAYPIAEYLALTASVVLQKKITRKYVSDL